MASPIKLFATLFSYFFLLYIQNTVASDHVDGEQVLETPAADISDLFAFPSPQNAKNLVIILNSYPFVPKHGHFSEQLMYSIRIRPISIRGEGLNTQFSTMLPEFRFDCRFTRPHDRSAHLIRCSTPSGEVIESLVGDEEGGYESNIRLFAGKRSDPFLFSSKWIDRILFQGCVPPAEARNDLANLNVLSIVLEIDIEHVLKRFDGPFWAIVGEIRHGENNGSAGALIDRVGRPEMSNIRLVAEVSEPDLRERYNNEDGFAISQQHKNHYRERIEENLQYYDELDGVQDWSPAWTKTLADLLVDDYLVIDISKPFSEGAYFDIENSLLRSQPHTRSGGRVPGERVINTLMTTMINGNHSPAISDGIEGVSIREKSFPYLDQPSQGPWPYIKRLIAPSVVKKLSLKKREPSIHCK